MDRMSPPPNYYGSPYPPQGMDMGPYGKDNVAPPPRNFSEGGEVNSGYRADTSLNEITDYFASLTPNNIGHRVNVCCTFPDSAKWHDKVFSGFLVDSKESDIVIYDPDAKKYYMIVNVYINFIELDDSPVTATKK